MLHFTQTYKNDFSSNQYPSWFMCFILPLEALESRWQSLEFSTCSCYLRTLHHQKPWQVTNSTLRISLWNLPLKQEGQTGTFETRVIYSYPLEGPRNSCRNWKDNQAIQVMFNALKTSLPTRWLYKITLQWKTRQRKVLKHFSEVLSLFNLWVRRVLHSTQHPSPTLTKGAKGLNAKMHHKTWINKN